MRTMFGLKFAVHVQIREKKKFNVSMFDCCCWWWAKHTQQKRIDKLPNKWFKWIKWINWINFLFHTIALLKNDILCCWMNFVQFNGMWHRSWGQHGRQETRKEESFAIDNANSRFLNPFPWGQFRDDLWSEYVFAFYS